MSDPSKSEEMKERWRDPEYRARMTQALHKGRGKYLSNGRTVAESIYRCRRESTRITESRSSQQPIPR